MTEHVARAPHDGTVLATLTLDTEETIDAKVARSRAAMHEWAASSPVTRERALLDVAARTAERLDDLVEVLSLEQGKTRKEGLVELDRYLGALTQYAGLATVVGGRHMRLGGGVSGIAERVPAGLVAGIVPWNFPASLCGTKLAPALAAGCGFLIKPAISTALVTQQLVAIANTVLPAGLLDVVVGGADAGEQLVRHDDVDRVAFTGSTGVGRVVARDAAEHLKPCTLELGGSDPFVLCADADLTAAVRALMGTRFYNAGQVCVAPKRLIVERPVADEVVERLTAKIARIVPGPGLSTHATMGPLHSDAARSHYEAQLADAARLGAKIVGGGRPGTPDTARGWFVNPALVIDPPRGTRVRQEEVFGPALTVLRFGTDEEALAIADETPHALGASVWSGDTGRARRLVRRISAGHTWVNTIARVYDELPFGAARGSGFGREHGVEAMEHYTEYRTLVYAD